MRTGRPAINATGAMSAAERQRKHRASVEARLEARLAAIEADLASVRARLCRLGVAELPDPEPRQALPDPAPLHSRW